MPGSMINISMKSIGQEPDAWAKQVSQDFHFELQNEIFLLGEKTQELIQGTIKSNIKRDGSSGKLEGAMKSNFDKLVNHSQFWIGDIDFLNAEVKYWHWLNYGIAQSGRTTPPANRGHWNGTQWIHTTERTDSWMTPTKPIEAINYIETAIFMLEQEIPMILAKIDAKLEGGSGSGKSGKQWWGSRIDFNPEGFKGSSQHTYGGK